MMASATTSQYSARQTLSVVICTRQRAASLALTLESLWRADQTPVQLDVIVVDNGSSDATASVFEEWATRLPLRYVREERVGKSFALNAAVEQGRPTGDIIAFIDDDITVHYDWLWQVTAACHRWREHDLFTGSVQVIWPDCPIPSWAYKTSIHGWAFAATELREERGMRPGEYPFGGHFWVTRRVLHQLVPFPDVYFTEAQASLRLTSGGVRGVFIPRVIVGHRIQPGMLDEEYVTNRARQIGQALLGLFRSAGPPRPAWSCYPIQRSFGERLHCARYNFRWRLRLTRASIGRGRKRDVASRLNALMYKTYYGALWRNWRELP